MSDSEVQQFYDEFSQSVMLKYFRQINARLEGVKGLCDKFIRDGANILEVGCGVGLLTKHLQKRANRVVAIDISETALKIARAYADHPRINFFLLDFLESLQPIETYGLFDIIVMADVIEHVPKDEYKMMFESLERFLTPNGILILTFPTPQHQVYLSEKEPEKLQIIDETVSIREILAVTSLCPYHMSFFDADGKNKYIHLVLRAGVEYAPHVLTNGQKIVRRLRNFIWATRNRRFVKRIQETLSA